MVTRSVARTFTEPINSIKMNGSLSTTFNGLCAVGFLARASYALARTPVLALFAASLGAGPMGVKMNPQESDLQKNSDSD